MVINECNEPREENIGKKHTYTYMYTHFEVVNITVVYTLVSRMCYDDEHKINIATMPRRYLGTVLRFRYHSGPHFLINTTQIFSRRRIHVQCKV